MVPSWRRCLNSPLAIEMRVYVVRAFVQSRELANSHQELARRLDELDQRVSQKLATHDRTITDIMDAIRELMTPPPAPVKRPIGFVQD